MFATAWAGLERGASDPGAPMRFAAFATISARGAEARYVVLRGADRASGTLTIFTDAATSKVEELSSAPTCTLLFWDPEISLQIRCRGHVGAHPDADALWEALADRARALYGGTPAPGSPLDTPEDHRPAADRTRFAPPLARVDEIETLRLGTPHERAAFRRADGFTGRWVAP